MKREQPPIPYLEPWQRHTQVADPIPEVVRMLEKFRARERWLSELRGWPFMAQLWNSYLGGAGAAELAPGVTVRDCVEGAAKGTLSMALHYGDFD